MKITIVAVGTRMPDWVTLGFEEYKNRMPKDYAVHLIEIPAEKRGKTVDLNRLRSREAEQIQLQIPKNNLVIALSERGQLWNNQELAAKLQQWHDQSQDITLLIGGPEGLSANCLQSAHYQWSLSPLTFPHPLVRIILAEQLYRSWSIIHNHPYHRI